MLHTGLHTEPEAVPVKAGISNPYNQKVKIRVVMRCPKCGEDLELDRRQLQGTDDAFCHSAECDWTEKKDWRGSLGLLRA